MPERDEYGRGAADAFWLIMRAFQEIAPAPHNDPLEPSSAVLLLEEQILDVLRDVAEGELTLYDPADAHPDDAEEAYELASEVMSRHRRLAAAITGGL